MGSRARSVSTPATASGSAGTRAPCRHRREPGDLHDEFALVTPAAVPASAPITVLLDASNEERTRAPGAELPGQFDRVRSTHATAAAAIVFGMSAVAMLLVCLVAVAGFIVIAQRRSRQLGLLAAVGATNKHLRLVMLRTACSSA